MDIKAVIMAGGEGTRLRPLTCDIPKPMARLLGRPIIEYILDLLMKNGVREASLTLKYLPDRIMSHFPEGKYKAVDLSFIEETVPLGTAGSVKNASDARDMELLVISGDALCDFDLESAVKFHRESGADATIVVKKVEDPREYGLVDIRADCSIAGFVEKPAFSQAISDLANTGIYILNRSALDMIPDNQPYDFAKDLFREMLCRSMKLMAYEDGGYWCDIGDLNTYIACQKDMLEGRVDCDIGRHVRENGVVYGGQKPDGNYRVTGASYIGEHVFIGDGCVIEDSIIDDGARIFDECRISSSVILSDAYVGSRSLLTGALLCPGSSVKEKAMMFEGAVLGFGAKLGRKNVVNPGVKIWPKKEIDDSITVMEHVKTGTPQSSLFSDDGIIGTIGVDFTPEFCARLGCAIGSHCRSVVAVGCHEGRDAKALKSALSAGLQSTGSHVMDFGVCFQTMFEFFVGFCGLGTGVYILGGSQPRIKILSSGGLPSTRETERAIEGFMTRGEFMRAAHGRFGDSADMSGMRLIYEAELLKLAPNGLSGASIRIVCPDGAIEQLLIKILEKLGCDTRGICAMQLKRDGSGISFSCDETKASHSRLLALACKMEFERGNDVALRYDAPRIIDDIAAAHGRKVLRYFDCPADGADKAARQLASSQLWARDAVMLCVKLLSYSLLKGRPLQFLLSELPEFNIAEKTLETPRNPAGIIRKLNTVREGGIGEGIVINDDKGIILIRPLKKGRGLKIYAESVNYEVASELCEDISVLIRSEIEAEKHE